MGKNNTLSALLLSHHITLDTHDPSALLYKLESSNSNLHRSSALRIPQPPSTCIAPILWDNHGLLLPRNSRTLPHHPPVQRQADSSERVESAMLSAAKPPANSVQIAKKLSQLVKMEKNVMRSMEQVGRERMEVAQQLSIWGEACDDDVSDVTDKLGVLIYEIGELEDQYIDRYDQYRVTIKSIRNIEASVQPIIAGYGKHLLELVDDTPVTPGETRAAYDGYEASKAIIQDCEDALTNWVTANAKVSSTLSTRAL